MNFTDFPETAIDFENRFPDNEACWHFLWNAKWPDGFSCHNCKGDKAYHIIERDLEECASCGAQTSVTAGTLFHGTRTPLRHWFRAIFEFISRKHGCNAKDIQRLIGLSYPTAWRWLHKIRETIGRRKTEPLNGTVEVDETYVGGPEEGVMGRDLGEKKLVVCGAVEVLEDGCCGRARVLPVPNASTESVQSFVSNHVAEGSTVLTDGWPSYRGLENTYSHKVEIIGDPKMASIKFPHIHRVFSLLKRLRMGTYHGSWSEKHAAAYCGEWEFRFNRRRSGSRSLLFQRVIEAAQVGMPSIFRRSRAKCAIPRAA
jgi:transposase-like protein